MKTLTLLSMLALASTASATTLFCANEAKLSACATFSASGTNLIVELRNTSLYDVMKPEEVLTAVFWSSHAPLSLAPTSAVLSTGSTIYHGLTDPLGVVGGEW
ncbi:MAG: hypothetical protein N2445_06675, partial [Acidobacteria bacterium]|nr:hypothetical protein [Acidobacteriota bacterium]